MAERPQDLPDFDNPPVAEVVLSLQFDPISDFRQPHFGLFWDRVRNDYPVTVDQARLESPVLSTGGESAQPKFQLQISGSPPTQRTWFVSRDDERLIQLQDDRLVHNWRYRGGSYPRFEALRDEFWTIYSALVEVITSTDLPTPSCRQVEVTYLNWLDDVGPSSYLRPVGDPAIRIEGAELKPDFQQWLARYSVVEDGVRAGFLTIESKPGTQATESGTVAGNILSLSYLGPLEPGGGVEAADRHMLLGRELIVRAFADITEPGMHVESKWGRRK